MNCRPAQRLLSAERDGALAAPERADLDAHLAQCAGCRQVRAELAGAVEAWRAAVARVPAPDEERAWQDLRREIRSSPPPSARGARGLWRWTLPLGAAAALALALITLAPRWSAGSGTAASPQLQTARADFVEVPNDTSSMVYVDDQSGWLVVWAVDDKHSG